MQLRIDDEPVIIVSVEPFTDGTGWKQLFVKPEGAEGGAHSRHSVPYMEGSFRVNGHHYFFEATE